MFGLPLDGAQRACIKHFLVLVVNDLSVIGSGATRQQQLSAASCVPQH
jgi:hypothetical protein